MWLRSALTVNLKQFWIDATSGDILYDTLATIILVDHVVIVPGAMETLLTGLVYSVWSRWG